LVVELALPRLLESPAEFHGRDCIVASATQTPMSLLKRAHGTQEVDLAESGPEDAQAHRQLGENTPCRRLEVPLRMRRAERLEP